MIMRYSLDWPADLEIDHPAPPSFLNQLASREGRIEQDQHQRNGQSRLRVPSRRKFCAIAFRRVLDRRDVALQKGRADVNTPGQQLSAPSRLQRFFDKGLRTERA